MDPVCDRRFIWFAGRVKIDKDSFAFFDAGGVRSCERPGDDLLVCLSGFGRAGDAAVLCVPFDFAQPESTDAQVIAAASTRLTAFSPR